ncbi:MAG: phosphoribosylformylglycinamidine cyclo-ligase [Pirellulaceae bacterium]|nr:phosphoribosylformylglycinamidine cyclo-ligase [Pirellulaceae bacterium]
MGNVTYKDAGVDLELYSQAMERLPRLLQRTYSPRVIKLAKGFAGLFQLDFASPLFARNYQHPVLVSGTDGVGTKLKVARLTEQHNTVGIDLVAMCVNDVLCCGAEPLFFLDYVALPQDDPPLLEQLVQGISTGCITADCALLGGETAILPDLYQPGDYDLAGFCVGVVERNQLIDGSSIVPGDVVLGLASSGFHSNGYSLIRRVVFDLAGLGVEDPVPQLGTTVGEALMAPTRIYTQAVRSVLNSYKVKNVVHGIAHITGGGLAENLARILPAGTQACLDRRGWKVPELFHWLQNLGNVDTDEMYRVFNMGIGMTLVVRGYYTESIRRKLKDLGIESWPIGRIEAGDGGAWLE